MSTLTVETTIPATPERLWGILQDFGGIARWNRNLAASRILDGKAPSGVGAERQCDLSDGRSWIRERVVEWTPGESMKIEIFEGTMPLSEAQVTLGLRRLGPGTTAAFMTMSYRPRMGVFGALLDGAQDGLDVRKRRPG